MIYKIVLTKVLCKKKNATFIPQL